jgi:hypothetical protein
LKMLVFAPAVFRKCQLPFGLNAFHSMHPHL